jgi:hypothetical protein
VTACEQVADQAENSRTTPELDIVAKLLQQDAAVIERALITRTVTAGVGGRGSVHSVPLDVEKVRAV